MARAGSPLIPKDSSNNSLFSVTHQHDMSEHTSAPYYLTVLKDPNSLAKLITGGQFKYLVDLYVKTTQKTRVQLTSLINATGLTTLWNDLLTRYKSGDRQKLLPHSVSDKLQTSATHSRTPFQIAGGYEFYDHKVYPLTQQIEYLHQAYLYYLDGKNEASIAELKALLALQRRKKLPYDTTLNEYIECYDNGELSDHNQTGFIQHVSSTYLKMRSAIYHLIDQGKQLFKEYRCYDRQLNLIRHELREKRRDPVTLSPAEIEKFTTFADDILEVHWTSAHILKSQAHFEVAYYFNFLARHFAELSAIGGLAAAAAKQQSQRMHKNAIQHYEISLKHLHIANALYPYCPDIVNNAHYGKAIHDASSCYCGELITQIRTNLRDSRTPMTNETINQFSLASLLDDTKAEFLKRYTHDKVGMGFCEDAKIAVKNAAEKANTFMQALITPSQSAHQQRR